ncbi:MAG: glycerophosphodiester phosphodiesterase [Luteitalea sp.]|nr:glycerophosphodiester phosphodiesterase [Luteitalea sp.]
MPENTCEAFANGLALGAQGVELDCRLSRDRVVMVHHDATLDRTTNGRGPISARTADELRALDAAHWFAPSKGYPLRGKGIRMPRLVDVLQQARDAALVIELKGIDPTLGRVAVEVVRRAGALERVCFGGYSLATLRAAREAEPTVITSACLEEVRLALYKSWVRWPLRRLPYRALQVPEHGGGLRIVSPRFVRAAHRAGLTVHVWTVDEPREIARMLDWGADGIITDRPDEAVPAVQRWLESAGAFSTERRGAHRAREHRG